MDFPTDSGRGTKRGRGGRNGDGGRGRSPFNGPSAPFHALFTGTITTTGDDFSFELPAAEGAVVTIDGHTVIYQPSITGDANMDGAVRLGWWRCGRFVRRSSNPDLGYELHVPTVTAGDVHAIVCAILAEKGLTVPPDSWPRVRAVLSEVTGHAVDDIAPQSLLIQDLGFA